MSPALIVFSVDHKKRVIRRKKLVDLFGGECEVCGYKKCLGALTFHHKKPKDKKFGLRSGAMCKSWEKIIAESKKCALLCCRCHAEVHAGLIKLSEEKD